VSEGSSKPYIVSKMTDEVGKTVGAHFGYFERKQDVMRHLVAFFSVVPSAVSFRCAPISM